MENDELTVGDIKQMIAELLRSQAESAARQDKIQEEIKEIQTESVARQDKIQEEIKGIQTESAARQDKIQEEIKEIQTESAARQDKIQEEIKEIQAESAARMDRLQAETNKIIKETNRRLESFGIVQGEVAEDLFRRCVKNLLEQENIRVDEVVTNLKRTGGREYDIVAVNGTSVVVFEVKNKLRQNDVEHFIEKQLPDFKKSFPEFADCTVYGGIGALVVKKELESLARENGLFVLTQRGEDNAELTAPDRLISY